VSLLLLDASARVQGVRKHANDRAVLADALKLPLGALALGLGVTLGVLGERLLL
jgi:hypothetical protein